MRCSVPYSRQWMKLSRGRGELSKLFDIFDIFDFLFSREEVPESVPVQAVDAEGASSCAISVVWRFGIDTCNVGTLTYVSLASSLAVVASILRLMFWPNCFQGSIY